ncbi:hypothetical protein BaRGS_00037745 [Batillaria attramentaria]|uniref:Uncharacterized protein n=1 Tax=Batillaria attramentaria TaxID=370345 RepID=A0ABD0J8U5_9CAEN
MTSPCTSFTADAGCSAARFPDPSICSRTRRSSVCHYRFVKSPLIGGYNRFDNSDQTDFLPWIEVLGSCCLFSAKLLLTRECVGWGGGRQRKRGDLTFASRDSEVEGCAVTVIRVAVLWDCVCKKERTDSDCERDCGLQSHAFTVCWLLLFVNY